MSISNTFRRYIIAALFAFTASAQVPVTPIVQPHVTFVDASGNPCAGCSLFSYAAGTTTPLATYTDAAGMAQNPNPIIMDASGGPQTPSGSSGAIWLGGNSYKLVLKDPSGSIIWTVDMVKAGQLLPCSSANAVQAANSAVNALTCDPSITINTTNHTLNIGTLPSNHVTIGPLGTPTAWILDTTSPASALASLGGGSVASVFGRTGSVVAASGDYICSQISGAICSLPNLRYQTIQVAGAASPQQPIVNLIGGPGTTVACADNPGSTRTDCTITAIGDTPTTCNGNGCYYTKVDGTVVEWGVSAAVPTGADQNVVTVTFPLAFPSTTNLSFVAMSDGCVDTCGGVSPKNPVAFSQVQGTLSTSGVTVSFTGVTPTGGGGGVINATIHAHWQAIQKN